MRKNRRSMAQDGLTAELFLDSFEHKVSDVRSSTLGCGVPTYSLFRGERLHEFTEVNEGKVKSLIDKAPNKTSSLDPAPTWLIKEFSSELAPFLTILFNKSLQHSEFPHSFKLAEITPLLKKPGLDASIPGNYRPVSNLLFISKLLERVVK